jgi:hypothetical protein
MLREIFKDNVCPEVTLYEVPQEQLLIIIKICITYLQCQDMHDVKTF